MVDAEEEVTVETAGAMLCHEGLVLVLVHAHLLTSFHLSTMRLELPLFKRFLPWCHSNSSLSFPITFIFSFLLAVSFLHFSLSAFFSFSHNYYFSSVTFVFSHHHLKTSRWQHLFQATGHRILVIPDCTILMESWLYHDPLLSIFFSSIRLRLNTPHLHLHLLTHIYSMLLLTNIIDWFFTSTWTGLCFFFFFMTSFECILDIHPMEEWEWLSCMSMNCQHLNGVGWGAGEMGPVWLRGHGECWLGVGADVCTHSKHSSCGLWTASCIVLPWWTSGFQMGTVML